MGGLNKRSHLISIGQELIWSKGYDLCSIKDITTSAKVPKGSFYHYFESKEKFALEAMNDFVESFEEELPDNNYEISTLKRLIDLRIESIVKINYARECYISVMCHAFSDQEDSFRQSVLEALDQSNEVMKNLLSALSDKKLLKRDLDIAELLEFIDFAWRGARLKARMQKSDTSLQIFKKYLIKLICE